MGYDRNDHRYGRDDRYEGRSGGYDRASGSGDPRDRGFFDRAGDEIRSWFGDEEAERRRRYDERYDERQDRARDSYGRSDRDQNRYASTDRGGYSSPDSYPRWNRSNQGDDRGSRYSGGARPYSTHFANLGAGEDRQFDDRGAGADTGYGGSTDAGYRYGNDDDRNRRDAEYRSIYGNRQRGRDDHDVHGYGAWRDRQIGQFDRDYDEYRRENQSRFESEFGTWRQTRQQQRDSLNSAKEHQEVIGSDGEHIGTVDHVRGDRILLTKSDKDAGGHHHSIPSSWINKVDEKVHVRKTAAEAKQAWRDEEQNQGLFGRDRNADQPTDLNRSFSGTYDRNDR